MENKKIITERKEKIRSVMLSKREAIPNERREVAEELAFGMLYSLASRYDAVLSISSRKDELNLYNLNRKLAENGKLLLPRVNGNKLEIRKVDNVDELELSNWNIFEPTLDMKEVSPQEIDLAFIPAIAFDKLNHRIGYGKGLFDRLLAQMNHSTKKVGVGFKEQLYHENLPLEDHDCPLDEIMLF